MLFSSAFTIVMHAQPKPRPIPDWVFERPVRSNQTFYYHVEKATAETEMEARNAAYTQAFMQAALHLGIPLNTEDISTAIQSGQNVTMLSQRFTIPIHVVCYFSRKQADGSGWTFWILCQIAESGAIEPRFDDFNDCYKFDKFKHMKDVQADAIKAKKAKSDTRAIVASTFIPGMGQMLKGQYGAGAGFLLGEVALFGGGTAFYFMADKQNKVMTEIGVSYDDYNNAKNLKNSYNIAMYCCFAAGAALHIVNMCHAYFVVDKKLEPLTAFEPVIIPTYRNAQPSYAVGISWHHQF